MNESKSESPRIQSPEELALKAALAAAPEHNKGIVYERRFEEILQELIQEGEVEGFRATEKDSEEDQAGIDYWVKAKNIERAFQIDGKKPRTSGRKRANGRKAGVKNRYMEEHDISLIHLRQRIRPEFRKADLVKQEVLSVFASDNRPLNTTR